MVSPPLISPSAGELGNAVQDAFVIAVEKQARERLQRLSALKCITPVDMSQLSIKVYSCWSTRIDWTRSWINWANTNFLSFPFQLNQQKGSTSQDLSFLKEASPIYVTSLSGNSVTTSSSTTAHSVAGVNNELIVADSSEYARSQQDHVHRVRFSVALTICVRDDDNSFLFPCPWF